MIKKSGGVKIPKHIVCKNCILPDGFLGIEINSEGLCNICEDPTFKTVNFSKVQINDELRKSSLEDWNRIVKLMQKNHGIIEFDCIIGYSGGKDSTALLDTFVCEYGLTPLAVTIDTGFMTDVAKNNIKDTLAKMNLYANHIFIEDAISTFAKLYNWFFLNHASNERCLTIEVCHICTALIHTILTREAIKRDLQHVIIGFSPDQIAKYFYETSKEDVLKDGTPPPELTNIFTKNDLQWYLDPKKITADQIPRVLYPYHVIEYDENEVINRIETKGLIEAGKGDPILTNCHVVKAALMYDFYRYGGIPYALQYAELVRQKKNEDDRIKSRKEWLRVYNQVARLVLSGNFNPDGMKLFFNKMGVSESELLETIEKQRDKDPNKDKILKNIDLIRRKKLR